MCITILGIVYLLIITSIHAQIYYWIDENGVKHYSSEPPSDYQKVTDFRVEQITSNLNADSSAKSAEINKVTVPDTNSQTNHIIQIYTGSDCSRCDKAKGWLTKAGYEYTEYNVDNNEKYKNEYKSYGGSELPFIIIDGEKMQGWQGIMTMVAMLGIKTSE